MHRMLHNLIVLLIVTPDAKVPVKIRDGETAEMAVERG